MNFLGLWILFMSSGLVYLQLGPPFMHKQGQEELLPQSTDRAGFGHQGWERHSPALAAPLPSLNDIE